MEAIYPRFGRELRRVRRQKKVTQSELAGKVGLGRTSIVNIENGRQRIHLHTLLDFASALEVSPTDFLPDQPEPVMEIVGQVQTLPPPERDWIMRVVSTPPSRRRKGEAHGAKT